MIVLHHTGTENQFVTAKEIDKYHRDQRGFIMVGYHYLLRRNSSKGWVIDAGRPGWMRGAHCKGHNDAIGIAVAGNYDVQQPQGKMLLELAQLIVLVCVGNGWLPSVALKPHSALGDTACPGRFIMDQWPELILRAEQMMPLCPEFGFNGER